MSSHARGSGILAAAVFAVAGMMPFYASAAVTTVQAVSKSDQPQQDVPVTFGQVFRAGDVPAGATLTALVGGQSIPLQVDTKATNPDGSLRHAVITVTVPDLPAHTTQPIELTLGAATPSLGTVTLDDVLATSFDASVSLQTATGTLTADARQLLRQAKSAGSCQPWGKQCNVWLSGPLVSEWIVGGPMTSPAGPAPHMAAYFYVRAYAGGPGEAVSAIRVNVVIENDWSYIPGPHNITYDATIAVGSNVYTAPAVTHYTQSRWHQIMWWGNKPQVYSRLDSEYLQASKAVSQYADVEPTEELLANVRQDVEPMGRGDQSESMAATGAQAGIGPLPRWTTAYLLSMDERAFRWMLANDDAAGHYGTFYRDRNTGRPLSIEDYPYVTTFGTYWDSVNPETGESEKFPSCASDGSCRHPYKADRAHEPSVGYLSYIVTGDFFYLEQLQFWADWNEVIQNPGYRDHSTGLLYKNQIRGQAWDLRALADAAFITPDDDPMKSYFVDMVHANIAWYNQRYTYSSGDNQLHILWEHKTAYSINGEAKVGRAPWMDDFFTWSIGHLVDLGFEAAEPLLRWKATYVVDRMTDPAACWILAAPYALQVRDYDGAPFYTSYAEAYAKTWPDLVGLECDSDEMRAKVWTSSGTTLERGQMDGYAWSPVGYPANMQPALAAAVNAGVANAREAWNKFQQRSVKPDYSDYANFAVVPRQTTALSVTLYASPNPVTAGGWTTLHWDAAGASSCTAPWMSGSAVNGEQRVGPVNGVITYSIQCTGPSGSSTETTRVTDSTVQKPVVVLTADPATVQPGQNSILSWDVDHAERCVASGGWSGELPMAGQKTIGPLSADMDFVLACRGEGGDTESTISVHVTSTAGDTVSQSPSPEGQQTVQQDASGGAGAFGGLAYLWLLGLVVFIRGRRF